MTLDKVRASFPKATIGICSIPPRKGGTNEVKRCNETARTVNSYLNSLAKTYPDKYVCIDTWSQLWSTKGHAIKLFYTTDDQKGVHLAKPGKDIIINTIMNALQPEPAGGSKRKNSSNHSPTAGQQHKQQILSSSPTQHVTPSASTTATVMNNQ